MTKKSISRVVDSKSKLYCLTTLQGSEQKGIVAGNLKYRTSSYSKDVCFFLDPGRNLLWIILWGGLLLKPRRLDSVPLRYLLRGTKSAPGYDRRDGVGIEVSLC